MSVRKEISSRNDKNKYFIIEVQRRAPSSSSLPLSSLVGTATAPPSHRGKHRYYFNKLNLAIRSSVGGGSIDDVADLKEVIVLCE